MKRWREQNKYYWEQKQGQKHLQTIASNYIRLGFLFFPLISTKWDDNWTNCISCLKSWREKVNTNLEKDLTLQHMILQLLFIILLIGKNQNQDGYQDKNYFSISKKKKPRLSR
jgi:hypothetical protein